MSKNSDGAAVRLTNPVLDPEHNQKLEVLRSNQLAKAKALLEAYNRGEIDAVNEFRTRVHNGKAPDFKPTLLQARLLVSSRGLRVKKLSLEKLKKEAKDLLKQLKQGIALDRLHTWHPKVPDPVKLADAQLIIARENGMESWAKLKVHIGSMVQAENTIKNSPKVQDGDLKTIHIRCGNDIEQALKDCSFSGEFFEANNPFTLGPVPHFKSQAQFINQRAAFIEENFDGLLPPEILQNVAEGLKKDEDTLLNLSNNYERAVLWYEHDSYDQLSKAYVLAHIAEQSLSHIQLECVQINNFPGVDKFIGIGQLAQMPESFLVLWSKRQSITPAMIAFAARCWKAFTHSNPTELWQLTQEPNSPLPLMQTAFKRNLMELPWLHNGLSLTEYLALEILEREGQLRPSAIFNFLNTQSEPLPYLGDTMLFTILRKLWECEHAAIRVVEEFPDEHAMWRVIIEITDHGRALLKGQANHLVVNTGDPKVERSVGGVKIQSKLNNWYWSPEEDQPVYRSQ